jgi:hypothetical protein
MPDRSIEGIAPYVERFLDNSYARESLDDAASALRAAYRRAARKGAAAPADRKFRDRVTDAVIAMRESADALQSGRRRPKGRLRKRVLLVAGAGVVGIGVALAVREDLRALVFGASTEDSAGVRPVDQETDARAATDNLARAG